MNELRKAAKHMIIVMRHVMYEQKLPSLQEAIDAMEEALAQPEQGLVISRAVAQFAIQMQRKLNSNTHKGGWDGINSPYLLKRLYDEYKELRQAVSDKYPDRIIEEAADIANFAMMIADNNRHLSSLMKKEFSLYTTSPAKLERLSEEVVDAIMEDCVDGNGNYSMYAVYNACMDAMEDKNK